MERSLAQKIRGMNTVRTDRVEALYRARDKSLFLRGSLACILVGCLAAWSSKSLDLGGLFQARRLSNLRHFLTTELTPEPFRSTPIDWGNAWMWIADWWGEVAVPAIATTVPIAVLAIVLAAIGALPAAILGARPVGGVDACGSPASALSKARAFLLRVCAVLARAIPEYVLAFCLLSVLGYGAWPAVLALALHNGGILARLGADSIEDLDSNPLRALRATGARESRVMLAGALPGVFPRFLLYFFYRFETCLRESTALGLLGIVSLGYFVEEARAHQKYDELMLLMALAAGLFALADWLSTRARRWLETAGEG